MNGILQTLKGLGGTRLAIIGGATVAALAFFVFMLSQMTEQQMTLLYGDMDLQDSAQIVSKLDTMKVPYQLRANGTQILVPQDQVLRLRLSMAQEGLPSGGSLGYEIFDRSDSFGTTSFVQNINQLRALEGELARTIRAIDGVGNVRVHLVLPKRELFSRDKQEATASILLKMRGSARLDHQQVVAIQNLAAAAVPNLKPNRISIIDEHGTLLAAASDDSAVSAQPGSLNELRATVEERLRRSIETLIGKSVGTDNVRAEVTADMDFDRVTTNQELYDPDGQVVRSTQTVGEQANSADQDPGGVSVGNNLPEAQAKQNNAKSSNSNKRSEETVNYEISKTVRTQTREGGIIKRLSVAVLVDGVHGTDDAGKPTYRPRSAEELQQLTALVQSAIGFDAKRGDTVQVVNMPFAAGAELPPVAEDATYFGMGKVDLFRLAELLVLGVVALLVLLLVVRPLLQRALAPRSPSSLPAGLPQLPPGRQAALDGPIVPEQLALAQNDLMGNNVEAMLDIARVEGQVKQSSLRRVGEIVEKHPEEAVAIMRTWLYQDG